MCDLAEVDFFISIPYINVRPLRGLDLQIHNVFIGSKRNDVFFMTSEMSHIYRKGCNTQTTTSKRSHKFLCKLDCMLRIIILLNILPVITKPLAHK